MNASLPRAIQIRAFLEILRDILYLVVRLHLGTRERFFDSQRLGRAIS